MEVGQPVESDRYAIVGGSTARNLKMEASADAFMILSNTLYREKIRAAVREVMCNANDAHLEVGEKRPIEVTVDNDGVTITDFGPGIADKRIVDIYGTYFASTKRDNAAATGGFGLGSKAPFAYTDHFSVTSHHDGKMHVYAMHMGGVETEGAPAIQQMAKMPTDRTGISVSIPLLESGDSLKFIREIKRTAYLGGIKTILNGELIETIDADQLKATGMVVPRMNYLNDENSARVWVLYGSVPYPIDMNPTLRSGIGDVIQCLDLDRFLMLLAKPNSLSVQPSREGLAYNQKTLEELKRLLNAAATKLKIAGGVALRSTVASHVRKTSRDKLHAVMDSVVTDARRTRLAGDIYDPGAINLECLLFRLSASQSMDSINMLARYTRDHARSLLRISRGSARSLNNALVREQDRYLRRRVLRILSVANDASLSKEIYVSDTPWHHVRMNFTNIRRKAGYGSTINARSKTIFIAPNKASITGYENRFNYDGVIDDVKIEKDGFFLIGTPSADQIDRITQRAKAFGFKVVVLKRLTLKSAVKKTTVTAKKRTNVFLTVPLKVRSDDYLPNSNFGNSVNLTIQLKDWSMSETAEAPPYYTFSKNIVSGYKRGYNVFFPARFDISTIADGRVIGLCRNETDLKRFKKAKSKNLTVDLVEEYIRLALKYKRHASIYAIDHREERISSGFGSRLYADEKRVGRIHILHEIVGLKPPTDEHLRLLLLSNFIRTTYTDQPWSKINIAPDPLFEQFRNIISRISNDQPFTYRKREITIVSDDDRAKYSAGIKSVREYLNSILRDSISDCNTAIKITRLLRKA